MRQHYAAEATRNPIWLFQIKDRGRDIWRTESVFSSREEGEKYGNSRPYEWGKKNIGWRVYSVCCQDEKLAKAMAEIRPDLVDEYSVKTPSMLRESS